ncbi:MAG: hypothetical protein JXA41_12870 [Deltaproteobacteria bacterium]|nr:hypothetical protein [Deltaproteobacteria bacterium]
MKISQLASKNNLQLAWRRITTGGNNQYKRFFRHLYYTYEIALNDNLNDLRQRIIGGTFKPQQPERVYLPKKSGLHRPISLLHIEDQIVLQAFANLAAKQIHKKRAYLQFKFIFSNILQKDDSIFFFRQWQDTYAAFQKKIKKNYDSGLKWVADFDLAAFYDTISHELLLKTIYPKLCTSEDCKWIRHCLSTWSSERSASSHGHGIPQGPIASDFLAECFLLPVDIALQQYGGYARYVDDMRLLGHTQAEVRSAVIELERHCWRRGLIPQSGKFSIKRARNIQDAMGMLPSIADPQHADSSPDMSQDHARRLFRSSIDGKPYKIKDKTRLRYVLFRSEPDPMVLNYVLRLIPNHPEHADAFFNYIGNFNFRKPILRLCLDIIFNNPYPYVRGEAWHVLARYLQLKIDFVGAVLDVLKKKAIDIAKSKYDEYFMEKWGVCHFLAALEKLDGHRYSRFLDFQSPLLQALLAPILPDAAFAVGEAADKYLHRSSFEPGLSICGRIHNLGLSPRSFGISDSELPSQVRNTFCQLGVLPSRGKPIDPIAEILKARYNIAASKSWHLLLGNEYIHALGLLKQAEATFKSGASFWLQSQNAFNNAIFMALQRHFKLVGNPAVCTTVTKNNQLVDFGVMMDPNGPFSRRHPIIADCFREMNDRRNHLPVSHPYEKKTALRCSYLKVQERNRFVNRLRAAYSAFIALMP